MSAPSTVPDTALGFTQAEIQILRQQQQILNQRSHQGGTVDRGRGTSRHSQPSSRAASAASSQGVPGRVVLDPRSLQSLYVHFENLMRTLASRINDLDEATQQSVNSSSDRAGRAMQNADAEIRRMRQIILKIEELEAEFERVKHIRDIIRALRARVEASSDRLDRSRPSNHSHGSGNRHDRDRHRN